MPIPEKSIRRMLVVLFVLGTLWFLYKNWQDVNTIEQGEHLTGVNWLPEEASDISFFKSYGFTAYEFTISETGFHEWTKDKKFPVSKITQPPVQVARYLLAHRDDPKRTLKREDLYIEIANGYLYRTRQENGGGYTVAYHSDHNRAYFRYSPR